jgi:hypothetical protein
MVAVRVKALNPTFHWTLRRKPRNVLNLHIETDLLGRTGKAITNFNERLPVPNIYFTLPITIL